MTVVAVVLLLVALSAADHAPSFEPLRLLLVVADGDHEMPREIEQAMLVGAARIEDAVSVVPLKNPRLATKDVLSCMQLPGGRKHEGKARLVRSNAANPYSRISLDEDIILRRTNFAIVVEINSSRCNEEPMLMANAKPCAADAINRPSMAILRVCPQLDRWQEFRTPNASSDVFRHELLHALGFGTIIPDSPLSAAPEDELLHWNAGANTQIVMRKFMDFSNSSTEFARDHFNCSLLEGIEAESADKTHLSEYIYGTELMTPIISATGNYFTEISARILEETHLGAEPWYAVNRSSIAPESAAYAYGRRWGCVFVARSCYDYVADRLRHNRTTFPFCAAADYARADRSLHVCAPTRQALRCDSLPFDAAYPSRNGITALPLAVAYPGTPTVLSGQMPSGPETRFCPFVEALSADTAYAPPPLHTIAAC